MTTQAMILIRNKNPYENAVSLVDKKLRSIKVYENDDGKMVIIIIIRVIN